MRFLHRRLEQKLNAPAVPPTNGGDTSEQYEPYGHVHPSFRHWTWFRPNDL